jgi:Dolichyl-phosphate-mannose-protein mannosyltransferase
MIETVNSSRDSEPQSQTLESFLRGISDRFVYWALFAIAAYSLLRSITYALAKPFWFDEVLTYVVSREGKPAAIWAALKQGVDGNPPTFYILEHFAASLMPNEHLGYRLLSIIGFVGTLLLLFVFLRTRYGLQRALLCSSLLLITPLFTLYAEEARPYSLVAALIALAMVCYQRVPRVAWTVCLGASLVLAALLHYYTPLTLAPFFLAELAFSYFSRKIRFAVWLALALPLVPIAISWPRLMWMKHNWGPHFWAGAALSDVSAAYGNYFRVGSPWGMAICGLAILIMLLPLLFRVSVPKTNVTSQRDQTPLAECALIASFVALPLLGFTIAKVTHGPFVERYFLAAIFGIVATAAFVLQRASPKTLFGAAILLSLAVSSQEIGFWKSWVGRRTPASIIAPVASLADASPYRDLPIVVSDAGEYVELWHYAPPDLFKRVVTLPDPELAATYAGTDTVDRLVLALRIYGLSGIQDFPAFTAEHPRFLLYSNGSPFDWWPTRLSHDGYQLQLIKPSSHSAVYLVGPKPN